MYGYECVRSRGLLNTLSVLIAVPTIPRRLPLRRRHTSLCLLLLSLSSRNKLLDMSRARKRYEPSPEDPTYKIAGLPANSGFDNILNSIRGGGYKGPIHLTMKPDVTVTLPSNCVRKLTEKASRLYCTILSSSRRDSSSTSTLAEARSLSSMSKGHSAEPRRPSANAVYPCQYGIRPPERDKTSGASTSATM